MQVDDTRLYRVKAVAEHFDVSVATIYRAIESGQLDALKLGTGRGTLRVPGYALRAFAEECAEAAHDHYVRAGTDPATDDDGEPGDGLSELQADGMACVVCGLDYRRDGTPHVPVGRSPSGSQVFACTGHAHAAAGQFEEVAR